MREISVVVDGVDDLTPHTDEIDSWAREAVASCGGVSIDGNSIRVQVADDVPDTDPAVVALTEALVAEDWQKAPVRAAPVEPSLEEQMDDLRRQFDALQTKFAARSAAQSSSGAVQE